MLWRMISISFPSEGQPNTAAPALNYVPLTPTARDLFRAMVMEPLLPLVALILLSPQPRCLQLQLDPLRPTHTLTIRPLQWEEPFSPVRLAFSNRYDSRLNIACTV